MEIKTIQKYNEIDKYLFFFLNGLMLILVVVGIFINLEKISILWIFFPYLFFLLSLILMFRYLIFDTKVKSLISDTSQTTYIILFLGGFLVMLFLVIFTQSLLTTTPSLGEKIPVPFLVLLLLLFSYMLNSEAILESDTIKRRFLKISVGLSGFTVSLLLFLIIDIFSNPLNFKIHFTLLFLFGILFFFSYSSNIILLKSVKRELLQKIELIKTRFRK